MKTTWKSRKANTIIETVLVLPVLLYLGFGTVEFGYFFYIKHSIQAAAREGARAAIISTAANSDVNSAVSGALTASGLQASGYTVTTSPASITGASTGTTITVTVTCTWGTVGVRPLGVISSSKQVQGVVAMRRE